MANIPRKPLRVIIGANVRRLRTAQKLTQQALADRVETSLQTLNRIELGHNMPMADLLYALADALAGGDTDVFRQHTDTNGAHRRGGRPPAKKVLQAC